jgi:hypothetical protein
MEPFAFYYYKNRDFFHRLKIKSPQVIIDVEEERRKLRQLKYE